MNSSIKEIAEFCREEFRKKITVENNFYVRTLFFAIDGNDKLTCSETPHIFEDDAKACIMIHIYTYKDKDRDEYRVSHQIQYINEQRCVYSGLLDPMINVSFSRNKNDYYETDIVLSHSTAHHTYELFRCEAPWIANMQLLWDCYLKIKGLPEEEIPGIAIRTWTIVC